MMTITDFLRTTKQNVPYDFWTDLEILLCHALQKEERSYLILHGDEVLTEDKCAFVENEIMRRAIDKVPLAQILGYQDFYGRRFIVNENVLIPRRETEAIIDATKELVEQKYSESEEVAMMDVGTGSGCIAITLALEIPKAKISAIDKSSAALQVARQNMTKHHVKLNCAQLNYLDYEQRKQSSIWNNDWLADIVVANLPYVDENWTWLDKKALSHEPCSAIYASGDGLSLIESLLVIISGKCKYIVVEADPCQHSRIIAFASKHHLRHSQTKGYILIFETENN